MNWLANHVGGVQLTLLVVALVCVVPFVITLGRWFFNRHSNRRFPLWTPIIWAIIVAILLGLRAIAPSFLASFVRHEDPVVCTCTTQCTTETVNPDCPVCSAAGADLAACIGTPPASDPEPEYEDGYLLPVSLTEEQITAFVNRVDHTFIDRSLVGGENATITTKRNAAVTKYAAQYGHPSFEDGVNFPVTEWFPEFDKLRDKSLTLDQRLELLEKFFDAFDQEISGNIPYGIQVLDAYTRIPYIYKYNGDWIDGELALIDQFYAGTYVQPAENPGPNALEMAKIPTLDTNKYIGLDYLVVSPANGLSNEKQAREEWIRLCSKISAAMRTYMLRETGAMIVARTADISWCHPGKVSDSLVRMVVDDKNDNRDWLMLSASSKQLDLEDKLDAERSLIGINPEDSRFGIFTPNTPDPELEEPAKEKPPAVKTTTYDVSTVLKDTNGNILVGQQVYKSGLKNGASCTVDLPSTPNGYTLKRITVSNSAGDKPLSAVSVTINKANVLVTFIYEKNPEVRVVDYALTSDHGYYDSRDKWHSFGTRAEGRYQAGDSYSVKANYAVSSGYYPVRDTVTGTMPASDHTVKVVYEKIIEYDLYGDYVYRDSNGRTHILEEGRYLGSYEEGERYYHTPLKFSGYTATTKSRSGTMPDHDLTITFYYTKDQAPFDGNGTKDPGSDPANTGDANIGGGGDQQTDGEGLKQENKVPETDYNPSGSGSNGNTSSNPITEKDPHESSGSGGKEHEINNSQGGFSDGGTPPDTSKPVTPSTPSEGESQNGQGPTGTATGGTATGTVDSGF